MAFSVRVQTASWERFNLPRMGIEVPWWDTGRLQKDPRFTLSQSDGFRDFDAILSAAELRSLHELLKPLAFQPVFLGSEWRARISSVLYELERVLSLASPSDSFRVNVFEWESGGGD